MRRNTVAGVCGPAAKRPVGGDLTYVATWRGFVDVAFVIFARRVPDHHCRTVSPITLIRQYRFATLNLNVTKTAAVVIVVALGIDKTGAKHPLGLWEGATENATVCQGLLTDLGTRVNRKHRRRDRVPPTSR